MRPPIGYSALRKGRVSEAGGLYLVTKVARDRIRADWPSELQLAAGPLLKEGVPSIILSSLEWLQQRDLIRVLAYCLMPDHLHMLIQIGHAAQLSNIMRRFGSYTGLQAARQLQVSGLWSVGFQDHALRADTNIIDAVRYIEMNPVVAGYIEDPADWGWSSANWAERTEPFS